MTTARLTDARISALKPARSARDIRDKVLKGFDIRIMPSGRRRFFIHTQCDGRRIRKIIGDPEQVGVSEAREVAQTALAAIRKGQPATVSPGETLFEVAAEEMFRRHARHRKPSTCKVNRHLPRKQILPWFGDMQIADITGSDVRDWLASLHATPAAADRSAPVLSVIMTRAGIHGYRPENTNPCTGIRRYRPGAFPLRGRAAPARRHSCPSWGGQTPADGHRQAAPADRLPQMGTKRLCRKNGIVRLGRREVDGDHPRLEAGKTGPRTGFLDRRARGIIGHRLAMTSGEFVFPSPMDPARPVSDNLPLWYEVRREIGLEDVRLHDLRHSHGSQAVMQGIPLPVVARLPGHSQVAMTLRHAHACDREVEAAAERIGAAISEHLGCPFVP